MGKKSCTNLRAIAAVAATGAAAGTAWNVYRRRKADVTDGRGEWALVTGASGGIGKELAVEFARHGFNLVLVARSVNKLTDLKAELESKYGVQAEVIVADLFDEDAAQAIYDEVKARGIVVDQLVNNAGAGKQGRVVDADPEVMRGLIHLNITNLTLLCRLFGHDMVERGRGRILNVSSMGGFVPDPYFNVYGPTKAYELYLSETMAGELDGTGVTVSALCPGPTATNWTKNAGKKDSALAKDPADVAHEGFVGMQAGKLVIVPSADYQAFRVLGTISPAPLTAKVIARWQQALIAGAKA